MGIQIPDYKRGKTYQRTTAKNPMLIDPDAVAAPGRAMAKTGQAITEGSLKVAKVAMNYMTDRQERNNAAEAGDLVTEWHNDSQAIEGQYLTKEGSEALGIAEEYAKDLDDLNQKCLQKASNDKTREIVQRTVNLEAADGIKRVAIYQAQQEQAWRNQSWQNSLNVGIDNIDGTEDTLIREQARLTAYAGDLKFTPETAEPRLRQMQAALNQEHVLKLAQASPQGALQFLDRWNAAGGLPAASYAQLDAQVRQIGDDILIQNAGQQLKSAFSGTNQFDERQEYLQENYADLNLTLNQATRLNAQIEAQQAEYSRQQAAAKKQRADAAFDNLSQMMDSGTENSLATAVTAIKENTDLSNGQRNLLLNKTRHISDDNQNAYKLEVQRNIYNGKYGNEAEVKAAAARLSDDRSAEVLKFYSAYKSSNQKYLQAALNRFQQVYGPDNGQQQDFEDYLYSAIAYDEVRGSDILKLADDLLQKPEKQHWWQSSPQSDWDFMVDQGAAGRRPSTMIFSDKAVLPAGSVLTQLRERGVTDDQIGRYATESGISQEELLRRLKAKDKMERARE